MRRFGLGGLFGRLWVRCGQSGRRRGSGVRTIVRSSVMVEQVRGQGRGQGGGERKNLRMKERNLKGRGPEGIYNRFNKNRILFYKKRKEDR